MNMAPYEALKEKYGVQIDFLPFFLIEPLSSREFRIQRINVLDYTAIVFSARHTIDAFFQLCEELRVKVPETMKPYIERFDIYMGQPFSTRTNCAIASFEDILTINFASSIAETDVERLFFRKLIQDGIHVKIESNR